VKASDNNLLAVCQLTGIPKAKKGTPKILVTFSIDSNSLLTVEAVEMTSGEARSISIARESSRLSHSQVVKMVCGHNWY
jgi:molecular chaperone DnaK (HSP70)